jgi:hypothetical protein
VVHTSEEHDALCSRPGPWGNPFHGPNKRLNVRLFAEYLLQSPERFEPLRGLRLACPCNQRHGLCHVLIIARYLNGEARDALRV